MKFRRFVLSEQDALGGMPPPMGGPNPQMGGPPPGIDPTGGMGGPPGADPMGGMGMGGPAAMPTNEPPVIPRHADVWDVLDSILNGKSLKHDQQKQQQDMAQQSQPPMGQMPAGPALMS